MEIERFEDIEAWQLVRKLTQKYTDCQRNQDLRRTTGWRNRYKMMPDYRRTTLLKVLILGRILSSSGSYGMPSDQPWTRNR